MSLPYHTPQKVGTMAASLLFSQRLLTVPHSSARAPTHGSVRSYRCRLDGAQLNQTMAISISRYLGVWVSVSRILTEVFFSERAKLVLEHLSTG